MKITTKLFILGVILAVFVTLIMMFSVATSSLEKLSSIDNSKISGTVVEKLHLLSMQGIYNQLFMMSFSEIVAIFMSFLMLCVTFVGVVFAFSELRLKTTNERANVRKFLIWKLLIDMEDNKQKSLSTEDEILEQYSKLDASSKYSIKALEELHFLMYEMLKEKTICKLGKHWSAIQNPGNSGGRSTEVV